MHDSFLTNFSFNQFYLYKKSKIPGNPDPPADDSIPSYMIGVVVALVVIIVILGVVILFLALKVKKQSEPKESESHESDDKHYEMSMSRVSIESNLDQNGNLEDNFSDVEEIDPFKQSFNEDPHDQTRQHK